MTKIIIFILCIAFSCSLYHLYSYKNKYEKLFDAASEYNKCCARYKCTGVFVSKRIDEVNNGQ